MTRRWPDAVVRLMLVVVWCALPIVGAAGTSARAATSKHIYVVYLQKVIKFDRDARGNVHPSAVLGGLSTEILDAHALAFDRKGFLYVTADASVPVGGPNFSVPAIFVFAPGAHGDAAPVRAIYGPHTSLSSAYGIAIDATGRIYVSSGFGSPGAAIDVFASDANGDVAPIFKIEGPKTRLYVPTNLAFDSTGNLFVGQAGLQVAAPLLEFPPGARGNTAPTLPLGTAYEAYDMDMSIVGQRLFLTIWGSARGPVYVYSLPGLTPPAQIQVAASSATGDDLGHPVVLAGLGGQHVAVFSPDGTKQLRSIGGTNTHLDGWASLVRLGP